MNFESLFEQRELRRCLLLAKALEKSTSLDEALRLARAVEDFLGATAGIRIERPLDAALGLARAVEEFLSATPIIKMESPFGERRRSTPTQAGQTVATIPDLSCSPPDDASTPPELEVISDDGGDMPDYLAAGSTAAEASSEPEPATREVPDLRAGDAPADADVQQDDAARPASPDKAFCALASPDDIVRYLRQRDDVVVSAGEGAYLVNGRFREDLDRLVKRANGMRARQGLPLFQLTPPAEFYGRRQ